MYTPSQIKSIIEENHLAIRKDLGQNFLIDKKVRDRIIDVCDIREDDTVREIGPGLGALTESILPLCKDLTVVEKDKGLAEILREILPKTGTLSICNKDILRYKIPAIAEGRSYNVIGNLPYYITSAIIFYLIDSRRQIDNAFLTVQREVAQRIVSGPGNKSYGVLSCSVQYHCDASIKMKIPRGAFFPVPEVDSCLLQLRMRERPLVAVDDEERFFKIIKAAFNQRRKTILNALSNSPIIEFEKRQLLKAFEKAGLDPKIRAEMLGLQEFALLAAFLTV